MSKLSFSNNEFKHEIINPLTIISILVKENLSESSLALIDQQVNKIFKILNRDYTPEEMINVKILMEEILDNYKILYPELNIRIKGLDGLNINVNQFIFERTISNLLNNTVKHSGSNVANINFSYNDKFLRIDYNDGGLGIKDKRIEDLINDRNTELIHIIKSNNEGLGINLISNLLKSIGGSISYVVDENWFFSLLMPFSKSE